jgi:hypothetical protein
MSTITILPVSPVALPKVREAIAAKLGHARLKTRKRHPSVWKLAAGYRLMAWRSLRKGDVASAAMHAACSRALRDTLG